MPIFEEVRRDILEAIDAIAEQSPDCAAYLREHMVFDEEKGTVMYTGDPDAVKLSPVLAAG